MGTCGWKEKEDAIVLGRSCTLRHGLGSSGGPGYWGHRILKEKSPELYVPCYGMNIKRKLRGKRKLREKLLTTKEILCLVGKTQLCKSGDV